MIFEVAHQMALLPFFCLCWLVWRRGQEPGAEWWWLAGAFAVSWAADLLVDMGADPWVVGAVYPVSQAALVSAVFLTRKDAAQVVGLLGIVALANVFTHGAEQPDIFFRATAWWLIVCLVYERRALGLLRASLLVSFGLGWLAWVTYAAWPGWDTWLLYQAIRAAGIILFCLAALHPAPSLKLMRSS